MESEPLLPTTTVPRGLEGQAIDRLAPIWKPRFHRSCSAPAISGINESPSQNLDPIPRRPSIIRHALLLFLMYLSLGIAIYTFNRTHFAGTETHPIVDALYFCIVTVCTIGYGDITPTTALAKLFSIAFVIIGFGFIDLLFSGMVSYILDLKESLLLAAVTREFSQFDSNGSSSSSSSKSRRMKIVGLALGIVMLCIGVGTAALWFVEQLNWLDSFYLSVMSVSTVGYGDKAFKTMSGRLFAAVWLLVSTLAVARAFLYLAETRIDKRQTNLAKRMMWVLSRDMTVSDFLAADIDDNGIVTKPEYVIYKLKEMGKLSEKDIMIICNQFDRVDKGKNGKITLPDLLTAADL